MESGLVLGIDNRVLPGKAKTANSNHLEKKN